MVAGEEDDAEDGQDSSPIELDWRLPELPFARSEKTLWGQTPRSFRNRSKGSSVLFKKKKEVAAMFIMFLVYIIYVNMIAGEEARRPDLAWSSADFW